MQSPQVVAAALLGLPVISNISDPRYGAMLHLGERRLRRRPIPNCALTEEQRIYEGTHVLFIKCAWGWTPVVSAVSPIDRGSQWKLLDSLVGNSVLSAEIYEPHLELRLEFDNGMSMWVNPTGKRKKYSAYSVRLGDVSWVVYGDGHAEEERV